MTSSDKEGATWTVEPSFRGTGEPTQWVAYGLAFLVAAAFLLYKLHDIGEPFAYGNARWSDAFLYWFGMSHCDLGFRGTMLANVEGFAGDSPFFYRSVGPLSGLAHSMFLCMADGAYFAVRIIPLLSVFLSLFLLLQIYAAMFGRENGGRRILYLGLLVLGSPFFLKYGASDVGFWALPITLGLGGWLLYIWFLEQGKIRYLLFSLACFGVGLLSSWHAGVMALPVFVHIAFLDKSWRWRLRVFISFAMVLGFSTGLILLHQGLVSGDFLYPFKRALDRSGSTNLYGAEIAWGELLVRQGRRIFDFFGPVSSMLAAYWVGSLLLRRRRVEHGDLWILAFVLTGLFFGFLLRNAAYIHDYLIVGFLPGLFLAALRGVTFLVDDAARISRYLSVRWLAAVPLVLLFSLHGALAVKAAAHFEANEKNDLEIGEATVAAFLAQTLTDTDMLATGPSAGYAVVGASGVTYGKMKPHLSYLTRRPIRFVGATAELATLIAEATAQRRRLVFVQLDYGPFAGSIQPAVNAALTEYQFEGGIVYVFGDGADP